MAAERSKGNPDYQTKTFWQTTLLSTVENFLDPKFSDHPEHFEKFKVWRDEKSREWFGKIPVISVSFGSCKGNDYRQALRGMMDSLFMLYEAHDYLRCSEYLGEDDRNEYSFFCKALWNGAEEKVEKAISRLCYLLYRHYNCKPIILIDEYDTPLLEAYTDGYWNEMIGTCRQLFHRALKENPYYSRAIITGVTRVTKNSLFSDLNNIEVDTVTCEPYSDCFGFTEKEVSDALKCQNMDSLQDVKAMYDGFIFWKAERYV